jgi:hypothetical protein
MDQLYHMEQRDTGQGRLHIVECMYYICTKFVVVETESENLILYYLTIIYYSGTKGG